MRYAELGRSGVRASRVGMGCAAIGGYDYGAVDDDASVRAIHAALDAGVTFFDTADVYGLGHAEEVLGRALAGRPEAVIATKVGVEWNDRGQTRRNLRPERIHRAVDASLRRLRVDRIALYQIHWPDPDTPLDDTMAALERCREAGKVGHLGCCNLGLDEVASAQAAGRLETLQLSLNAAEPGGARAVAAAARRHGMTGLSYNTLAQGLFTGKYGRDASFTGTDLRQRSPLFQGDRLDDNLRLLGRLRAVAERHACTPAQVAVAWVLAQEGLAVALTGIKTAAQARENAAAADLALTSDDLAALAEPEGPDAPGAAPDPRHHPTGPREDLSHPR